MASAEMEAWGIASLEDKQREREGKGASVKATAEDARGAAREKYAVPHRIEATMRRNRSLVYPLPMALRMSLSPDWKGT